MPLSLFGTLRVAGLLFIVLDLIQVVWAWRISMATGGAVVDTLTLIVEKTPVLLIIGSLLIFLSLNLQIGFSRLGQLVPDQRPARFFKTLKGLFAIIALIHLLLIPIVFLSSSKSINAANKTAGLLHEQQLSIIQALKNSPTVVDANSVLQRYQTTYPVRIPILPENKQQIAVVADQLTRQASAAFSRNSLRIHREQNQKNLSFVGTDLIDILLCLLLWVTWPNDGYAGSDSLATNPKSK